jgi:hypothetical protein
VAAHLNTGRAEPLYAVAPDWAVAGVQHLPSEYRFRVQRGPNQVETWKVAIPGDRLRPVRSRPLYLTLFASGEVGGERNFNTVLAAHGEATRTERERARVEHARAEAASLAVRTRLDEVCLAVPGASRTSEFAAMWRGAGWCVSVEVGSSDTHADLTGSTVSITVGRGRYDTVSYEVHHSRIEEAVRLTMGFSTTILTLAAVEAARE